MKTLIKTTLITSALTLAATGAMASAYDDMRDAKASVDALSAQLESMGVDVTPVTFDKPMTFGQKEAMLNAKYAELQNQFNEIHFAK